MRSANVIFFIFLLLMPLPAQAWQWNGDTVPDEEWRKTDDGLGVVMLLTTNPDEFLDNWEKETPGVDFRSSDRIARGGTIVAFFIFYGCAPDEKMNCNLDVALKVIEPNGELQLDSEPLELWQNKPGPPEEHIELGAVHLGIMIAPEDPLGEYQIVATVRDRIAGKEMTLSSLFTAVETMA